MNLDSKKRADFVKWCVNEKYRAEYETYHAALSEEQRAPKHNLINRNTFAASKMVSASHEEKSVEYQEFCDGFDSGASYDDSDAKQAGNAARNALVTVLVAAAPAKAKKCSAAAGGAGARPAAAAETMPAAAASADAAAPADDDPTPP